MLDLSIIIATLNRGKLLLATVEQVLKQRFQNYEVWIVDQSDETVAAEIKESLAACLSGSFCSLTTTCCCSKTRSLTLTWKPTSILMSAA